MLTRILVPLDGCVLAEQAITFAAELSRPARGALLLLRVDDQGAPHAAAVSNRSAVAQLEAMR